MGGVTTTTQTSPPAPPAVGAARTGASWPQRILGILKYGPVVIGGVLWYAGISKALSPNISIESLSWAFDRAVWPMLFMLVAVEIVLGTCLVFRVCPKWSIAAGIVLFVAFSGWLLYLHATNAPVPCGCGEVPRAGTTVAESRWWAMGRNVALLALLVSGLYAEMKRPTPDNRIRLGATQSV